MEKSREEFEAWAKERGLIIDLPGIRSVNESFLNECWAAWQASRAAVVVKLPTKGMGLEDFFTKGINQTIDNCKKAIEAQGLTVK